MMDFQDSSIEICASDFILTQEQNDIKENSLVSQGRQISARENSVFSQTHSQSQSQPEDFVFGDTDDTIVKINTCKLENYLQRIKSHLSKHDSQLQDLYWVDLVKYDSDKLSVAHRKIEQCQSEINLLKNYIYSVNDQDGKPLLHRHDPMVLLQGEVDLLRSVCRRVELYQSEDLNIFEQLKNLHRDYRLLMDKFSKFSKEELIDELKTEFKHKLREISKGIEHVDSALQKNIAAVENKCDVLEKEVIGAIQDELQFMNEKLQGFDDEEFPDHDPQEAEDLATPMGRGVSFNNFPDTPGSQELLPSEMAKRSFRGGGSSVEPSPSGRRTTVAKPGELTRKRSTMNLSTKYITMERFNLMQIDVDTLKQQLGTQNRRMQGYAISRIYAVYQALLQRDYHAAKMYAFQKFRQHSEAIAKRDLEKVQTVGEQCYSLLNGVWGRYKQLCYFHWWKHTVKQLNRGERLRPWMQNIARRWLGRSKPDLKKYLTRWKVFIVNYYKHKVMSEAQSQGAGGQQFVSYDEFHSMEGGNFNMADLKRIAHKDLMRRLSMRDMKAPEPVTSMLDQMKFAMLSERVDVLEAQCGKGMEELTAGVSALRFDMARSISAVEEKHRAIGAQIESEASKASGNLGNFKSQVTTKFSHAKSAMDAMQEKLLAYLQKHDKELEGANQYIGRVEEAVTVINGKMGPMEARQRELLQVMERIEAKQAEIEVKMAKLDQDAAFATQSAQCSMEESRKVLRIYKEGCEYYDAEIHAIHETVKETESKFKDFHKKYKRTVEDIYCLLEGLQHNQEDLMGKVPTIEELFDIYMQYEAVMVTLHHGALPTLDQTVALEKQVKLLSKFASRVATNIAQEADLFVFAVSVEEHFVKIAGNNIEVDANVVKVDHLDSDFTAHMKKNTANKATLTSVVQRIRQKRIELLLQFLNKFNDALNIHDAAPGYVKAKARLTFFYRLKVIVEIALTKHIIMTDGQENNSFMTKRSLQPPTNAFSFDTNTSCIACNRPFGEGMLPKEQFAKQRPKSAQKLDVNQWSQNMSARAFVAPPLMNSQSAPVFFPDGEDTYVDKQAQPFVQFPAPNQYPGESPPLPLEPVVEEEESRLNSQPSLDRVSLKSLLSQSQPVDEAQLVELHVQSTGLAPYHQEDPPVVPAAPLGSSRPQSPDRAESPTTTDRPLSATAMRHRQAVKQSQQMLRSGFRMPVVVAQEEIAASLAENFRKDCSIIDAPHIREGLGGGGLQGAPDLRIDSRHLVGKFE